VRWWIGLCDTPAERAPRRQDGVALAMLVPGLAATIALADASRGALLDHAYTGHASATAASVRHQERTAVCRRAPSGACCCRRFGYKERLAKRDP
jgi:hypothetical protein